MNNLLSFLASRQMIIGTINMLFNSSMRMLSRVNWEAIAKVGFFNLASIALIVMLFMIYDRLFNYFQERRIKRHKLTIRNKGNVPSIFLLRSIDLPKELTVRFRVGESSMILVSQKPEATEEEKQPEEAAQNVPAETQLPETDGSASELIPNLNKPFDPVKAISETTEKGMKEVGKIGKKVGLLAGILGTISSLIPWRSPKLNQAQSALKGIQQDANNVIGTVNQKTGNINTLSNQFTSLVPDDVKKKAADVKKEAAAGLQQGMMMPAAGGNADSQAADYQRTFGLKNFSYDEEVWSSNIGKTDANNGSLIYAQSKILKPGESMQVNVELMNLSESNVPITFMYKIEVLQIPQTKLPLAAPRQFISGVVAFPKVSRLTRVLPVGIVVFMLIFAIQMLAGLSYLLFL